ncbi:MAG: hypothetical protein AVDCRST_MAG93-9971, partial [uncultured Chloroflexia bacterium]
AAEVECPRWVESRPGGQCPLWVESRHWPRLVEPTVNLDARFSRAPL